MEPLNEAPLLISGAANTCGASSVVWLPKRSTDNGQSVVAYPLHSLVAIASVSSENDTKGERVRVLVTLRGHVGLTNALSTQELHEGCGTELYSCGEDGSVRVWHRAAGASIADWQLKQTLSELPAPAMTMTSLMTSSGTLVSASDSTGKVATWFRAFPAAAVEETAFELTGTLQFPPSQIPHSLHYSGLSVSGGADGVALLIGGVDARIHIATGAASSSLCLVGSLPGHEEWVTTIASRPVSKSVFTSSSNGGSSSSSGCSSSGGAGEDAMEQDGYTVLVATGSKDFKTRVWRFQVSPHTGGGSSSSAPAVSALLGSGTQLSKDDAEADGEDINDDAGKQQEIDDDDLVGAHEARLVFPIAISSGASSCSSSGVEYTCAVYLETLLIGHEDWVSAVQWLPYESPADTPHLLSVSMDRNMIIWKASSGGEGIWSPISRFGDVGGMLGGSVGGNLLGFTAACFAPDGHAILGVGYGGSFHLYRNSVSNGEKALTRWLASPFVTGHYDAVTAVCWAPDSEGGEYLVSVSSDQTCRLYAPITCSKSHEGVWCEVSRPQIHGYNLTCVAIAPKFARNCNYDDASEEPSFVLYTAGDEKMVRVFDAPLNVLSGLSELCGIETLTEAQALARGGVDRAYIPELGLSNRGSGLMNDTEKSEYESRGVGNIAWDSGLPPLEGQLADYSVWPETKKLYGHTNDIVCMALNLAPSTTRDDSCSETSHKGRYLATACKARNAQTAAILLWDTVTMTQVGALLGHDSTVSCLGFSPDGRFLASSGKDRSLCLYERKAADDTSSEAPYLLYALQKGAHKRIVWDLSWAQRNDGEVLLVTASRDCSCKVWAVNGGLSAADRVGALECKFTFTPFAGVAVTAVEMRLYTDAAGATTVQAAVGSEQGNLQLWGLSTDDAESYEFSAVGSVQSGNCHGAAVRSLRWSKSGLLASAGDDNCLRVLQL